MTHKVGIIGHGFVGLACETGLQNVSEVRIHDKYKPSESLEAVVNNSNILFICVPTPMKEDGSCDTSIVEQVARDINKVAKKRKTVIVKSTVLPGTTEFLSQQYKKHAWIFNPEFLTEKNFINDFLRQDRIVIGTTSSCKEDDKKAVRQLYDDFVKWREERVCNIPWSYFPCSSEEAEMLKYVSNCFLATKVSFFNEIKQICDANNINYDNVINIVSSDERIGKTHLKVPGHDGKHGFGGSCFPKDLNGLINFALESGVDPIVLETTWAKNLLVREEMEWEMLPQVTGKYDKE
jgi:UDPglucose 6-dehydrogenase